MATLGFLRRDFEVFAIDGFNARMAKIYEFVRPRLTKLGNEMAPELSRKLRMEFFPHVPKHMRRAANPPDETWTAFGPSRAGYKRYGYLALYVSNVGIHTRAVLNADADNRAGIGRLIKSQANDLEKSFRGTKIQDYRAWDCRELPRSCAAGADFFEGLGDALEQRSGSIDVGFGWPVRDALTVDRAEVLDAFRELEPLYRMLLFPRPSAGEG
jgi:uncharacterized protein YktB (UPF0637 family)